MRLSMLSRTRTGNGGFSIVEVLVVLAIMGAIALIGTPAIISQVSHTRLKRAARDVVTELNAARVNAITKNTKYSVSFSLSSMPTPDTYSLNVFSGGSWQDDSTRTSRELQAGIDVTSPGASFTIYFYPNGVSSDADNATATSSEICLSNTNDSNDKMEINITGSTGRTSITTGC